MLLFEKCLCFAFILYIILFFYIVHCILLYAKRNKNLIHLQIQIVYSDKYESSLFKIQQIYCILEVKSLKF